MARPSKLSDNQWAEIERRLLAGEKPAALAKEFGIDRAAITRKFSQQVRNVKTVAQQIVTTEEALKSLPVAQQVQAVSLAADLQAISSHLASAAKYGSMTAHRLSGIAHNQLDQIDDAEPEKSMVAMQRIGLLTKLANSSAEIGSNLLSANKEMIRELNNGGGQSNEELLKELASLLPN